MKKNHNKGFSLVELIVVVLIMAIIAVVLAPQVTKWVQTSRESSDLQTLDSAASFAQMALTDPNAYDESVGNTITITIDDENGIEIESDTGNHDSFEQKFAEYAGVEVSELGTVKAKAAKKDKPLKITITNGKVATGQPFDNPDLEVVSTGGDTSGKIEEGGKTYYMVYFNTDGKGSVSSQKIEEGNTASNPGSLTYSGYSFKGWYTSAAKTTEFDFSTPINGKTTIYAKWESTGVNPPTPADITVIFTHNYDGKTYSEKVQVEEGQTATSTWTPADATGADKVTLNAGEVWVTKSTKVISNVSDTNKTATIDWTVDDSGKQIEVTFTHQYGTGPNAKTYDERFTVKKGETAKSNWTPAAATGDKVVNIAEGAEWKTESAKEIKNVSDTNKSATIIWTVDEYTVTFIHKLAGKQDVREEVKVTKGATATSSWTDANAGSSGHWNESGTWEHSGNLSVSAVTISGLTETITWTKKPTTITVSHNIYNDKYKKGLKKTVTEVVTLVNGNGTATKPYDNLDYCQTEHNNLNVSASRNTINWYINKQLTSSDYSSWNYYFDYNWCRVYSKMGDSYTYGLVDYKSSSKGVKAYIFTTSDNHVYTLTEYESDGYNSWGNYYHLGWNPTEKVITVYKP